MLLQEQLVSAKRMIFRLLSQNLWSHWDWTAEKGREAVDMSSSWTFSHRPCRFPSCFAFSCTFPNKTLLQVGCQERDWQFSETITKRGSNRAQESPTSTVRAWGRLQCRASLGFDTAACILISIRISAALTSATAPEPPRLQTRAGKPNSNEEHLNNELGEESAGN